ncbi:MAG: hypothetical protein Q8S11_06005 [Daejeonella sp.]|nr:hypothetical protein [Daejeonella sp.]
MRIPLSGEFPAITKIDFSVQQYFAVVQFQRSASYGSANEEESPHTSNPPSPK